MKNDKELCVYCNSRFAETQDHVPPKGFFPQPRPSNLITVPACKECNLGSGVDEEFFLASFMFSEAGVTSTGKTLWEQKLHRMYAKNNGLRRRIATLLRRVNLVTPSGLFIKRGIVIKQDEPRLAKVVAKIVRGLYYFEYKEPLDISTEIISQFLRTESDAAEAIKFNDQLLYGTRQWTNIFEYKFNRVEENHRCSMWVIRFFGKIVFWVISGNDNDFVKTVPFSNNS